MLVLGLFAGLAGTSGSAFGQGDDVGAGVFGGVDIGAAGEASRGVAVDANGDRLTGAGDAAMSVARPAAERSAGHALPEPADECVPRGDRRGRILHATPIIAADLPVADTGSATATATAAAAAATTATATASSLVQPDPQRGAAWLRNATTFKSKYYDVYSDLPRADRERLATHMDRMVDAYLGIFSDFRIRGQFTIELYLFESQVDYQSALLRKFGTAAEGSKGVCITRGREIALAAWRGRSGEARMREVLQHEGFHQFASAMFPSIPIWANEGLAEVFGAAVVADGRVLVGEVVPSRIVTMQRAIAAGTIERFADFVQVTGRAWNDRVAVGSGHQQYVQAWAMCHFLLYADGGAYQAQFLRYLALMNQGQSGASAWQQAFGAADYQQWERRFIEYVNDVRFTDLRTTIDRLAFLAAGSMELAKEEAGPARDFETLQRRLEAIGFTYEVTDGDHRVTVRAADASSFIVPFGVGDRDPRAQGDATFSDGPTFSLMECPRIPARDRGDAPSCIAVSGLFPRAIGIEWRVERRRGPIPSLVTD